MVGLVGGVEEVHAAAAAVVVKEEAKKTAWKNVVNDHQSRICPQLFFGYSCFTLIQLVFI